MAKLSASSKIKAKAAPITSNVKRAYDASKPVVVEGTKMVGIAAGVGVLAGIMLVVAEKTAAVLS